MSKGILSFDIGIKNLAWCLTQQQSGEVFSVLGWGNYNLLEDRETESTSAKGPVCGSCAAKAKFCSQKGLSCARHVPATHPVLKDLSGVVLSKIPAVSVLKGHLQAKGVKPLPKGRDAMIEALKAYYSVPAPKLKVPHAAAIDVSKMHDSIRTFVTTQLSKHFTSLTEVRLENQPVLKNPVMKTIQILLFATLRDAILAKGVNPTFKLVHAGMKVKGKESGDKGYKARKDGSEARTLELLGSTKFQEAAKWKEFFEGHKKRSDLADAFCMCLDGHGITASKNA
jgi:hypothetical protein